ncbi:hypothetical protein GHT06_017717 [Daphnia sinensis]|uniref:Uncharacterized protein n=1 Tax=Daphnia sinensis TaxID=1820382 RepID=A0AAD5KMN8_9CRUS|nr:hypothetical protein GHT06_017717 [Daphnia sinensis]
MEACVAVEKEIDKILSKFASIRENGSKNIEETIEFLLSIKPELEQAQTDSEFNERQLFIIHLAIAKVKETVSRLASEHRDLHSSVSKVGKTIDRNFTQDYASTSFDRVFSGVEKEKLLNQVICQHMYRHGFLEIGEELAKESGLEIHESSKQPFMLLNEILEKLRHKNLVAALEWAQTHREKLMEQNSSLEFKLHRLQFLQLVSEGPEKQAEALGYVRKHFPPFVHQHETDIQNLMGVLAFIPYGVHNSPYKKLFDPILWTEICEVFVKDACALLGFSVESPLSVCINVGSISLPALLNIKQVMAQRQVAGMWNAKDELPIEIDAGREYRYHSIFACPILRQQGSDSNPPMRLLCGHVISRDALNKLSSGNNVLRAIRTGQSVARLKCPYCPREFDSSEARQLHF